MCVCFLVIFAHFFLFDHLLAKERMLKLANSRFGDFLTVHACMCLFGSCVGSHSDMSTSVMAATER